MLEAGGGLEVVEVACPASHETFADPAHPLPDSESPAVPPREYALDGSASVSPQRFAYFCSADAALAGTSSRSRGNGILETDTGIRAATSGFASVCLLSRKSGTCPSASVEDVFAPAAQGLHLLFAAHGEAEVLLQPQSGGLQATETVALREGDAVALAPGSAFSVRFPQGAEDRAAAVLEVTVPRL